jgi:hypothetical protein
VNSADSCIRNYINGNLSDAKQQAKRVSEIALFDAAILAGKTHHAARLIAGYLKRPSREAFEAACQAESAPENCHGEIPDSWEACTVEQLQWYRQNGAYGQRLSAEHQLSIRK